MVSVMYIMDILSEYRILDLWTAIFLNTSHNSLAFSTNKHDTKLPVVFFMEDIIIDFLKRILNSLLEYFEAAHIKFKCNKKRTQIKQKIKNTIKQLK